MSFIDAYNASQNPQLNQRVRVALMQYADTVATEPPNTVNHSNRVILIGRVMAATTQYADLFTVYATAVSGITEASDDASILTAVGNAWTNFAGSI